MPAVGGGHGLVIMIFYTATGLVNYDIRRSGRCKAIKLPPLARMSRKGKNRLHLVPCVRIPMIAGLAAWLSISTESFILTAATRAFAQFKGRAFQTFCKFVL